MIFSDGIEVSEYINGILDDIEMESSQERQQLLQPVSLLLLDINMPNLNGIQALNLIKQRYEEVN